MQDHSPQQHVTAAEITRNFGMWQDRASQGPIVVTHHGRARCVLLSAANYEQMKDVEAPKTAVEAREGLLMQVLAERIDLAFLVVDDQFMIRESNTTAAIMLGENRDMLIERSLLQLWPAFEDSVAGAQIRRAMRMGSSTQTRLTIAGKAAHISAFPWPGGTGLIIRTADEDERATRAAAEVEAIHRLLTLDGQIGMVRLSPRGTMTDADPGFCAITKITADRLAGARLLDLVPRADRAILSDMIENVFNGCREACCSVRILDNDGQEVPAQIAITAIREDLGIGGALIMVRDRRPH